MESDGKVIRLTSESQTLLEEIQTRDWFSEAQDAARFCMAYAIKAGAVPGEVGSADTRWSVSGFDPKGDIQALVLALYPDRATPIRTIEHFVNVGIRMVHDRLVRGGDTPADLMQ